MANYIAYKSTHHGCSIPLFWENRFANISKLILFHICYGSYLSVKRELEYQMARDALLGR